MLVGTIATAILFALATVHAEPYPNRPIVLVIPLPPGGTNDIMARAVADKMSDALRAVHRHRKSQRRRQRHSGNARGRACCA
jgi:tripartite-type tricarboxylate transporter receptor subunit TctC